MKTWLAVTLVGAVIMASGCAEEVAFSDGVVNSPYRESIEQALTGNVSDFQKAILVDGVVTDSEVAEAAARFGSCLADKGYDGTFDPEENAYELRSDPGVDAAREECDEEFTHEVGGLYFSVKRNPDNKDHHSAVIDCLKRHGYLPLDAGSDITPESIIELITEENATCINNPWNS